MSPLQLKIFGLSGYLFTGPVRGTFAFVPLDCVSESASGELKIDDGKYLVSGWSRKNYLLNQVETSGNTLFGQDPIFDPDTPGLNDFIIRLERVGKRAFSPANATANLR